MKIFRFLFFLLLATPVFSQTDSLPVDNSIQGKVEFKTDTTFMDVILIDEFKVKKSMYIVKSLVQGVRAEPVERQLYVLNRKTWKLIPNGDQQVVWFRRTQ